jgi:hypothetical protein
MASETVMTSKTVETVVETIETVVETIETIKAAATMKASE